MTSFLGCFLTEAWTFRSSKQHLALKFTCFLLFSIGVQVSDMRRHLLGILVEQGFATYEQTEDQRPVVVAMWLANARSQGMPACLSSLIHAKEAGTEPIYYI